MIRLKVPLGPEFWYSIFLHFQKKSVVVSYHAKFQLITTTGSRFFRTVFVEILRPPLLALVLEAGLPISGSDVETHLKPRTFIRLLAAENLTVVEGRFPANCLLYGLEIFFAAAVINGIACAVQCYINKSNHRAGISLHQSLASVPAMEKWIIFVLTRSANFNPRSIFVGCSDHFTDECFQMAIHVEGSQRSIIPLYIPTIWRGTLGDCQHRNTAEKK